MQLILNKILVTGTAEYQEKINKVKDEINHD